jgi:hypothetical protein
MSRTPVRLEVFVDPQAERILREIGADEGLTAAEVAARFVECDVFNADPDGVSAPAFVEWTKWARYHRRLVAVPARP